MITLILLPIFISLLITFVGMTAAFITDRVKIYSIEPTLPFWQEDNESIYFSVFPIYAISYDKCVNQ